MAVEAGPRRGMAEADGRPAHAGGPRQETVRRPAHGPWRVCADRRRVRHETKCVVIGRGHAPAISLAGRGGADEQGQDAYSTMSGRGTSRTDLPSIHRTS